MIVVADDYRRSPFEFLDDTIQTLPRYLAGCTLFTAMFIFAVFMLGYHYGSKAFG